MREKFTFFQSYIGAAEWLSDEERNRFLLMVVRYGIYGEDPADTDENGAARAVFEAVRPNLDASINLSEINSGNGKRGGRPKEEKSEPKPNQKRNETEKKPNEKRKESESKAKQKRIENEQKPNQKRKKAEEEVEEEVEIEKEIEYTPLNPPAGEDARSKQSIMEHRFEEFWKVYPKKRSKDAAYRRFCKINPSEELLQTMIRAVEKQAKTDQWRKSNGDYIPYPATWLNSGGWKDEIQDSPTTSGNEFLDLLREEGLYDAGGNDKDIGYFAPSLSAIADS